MFDKAKMAYEFKKIQKALAKETVEVTSGAATVTMTGDQQVKTVRLDRDKIDMDDLVRLEKNIESAIGQAVTQSQQIAAEKMREMGGGLGLPGL